MLSALLLTACSGINVTINGKDINEALNESINEVLNESINEVLNGAGLSDGEAKAPAEESKEPENGEAGKKKPELTISELENDEALDAWFENLDEDPPVSLTHVIYGYAPYDEEISDKDIILSIAHALEEVKVKSIPEEYSVSDAEGDGLFFKMQDGSSVGFRFEMGNYAYGDAYYSVTSGYPMIPEYEEIYADDDSFKTKCLDCYDTDWDDEWGLIIVPGEDIDEGFLSVNASNGIRMNPGEYIEEVMCGRLMQYFEDLGLKPTSFDEYELGGRGDKIPGITLTFEDLGDKEDSSDWNLPAAMICLAWKPFEDDDIMAEMVVCYFGEDKDKFMAIADATAGYLEPLEFEDKHYGYRFNDDDYEPDVRPDNLLLDFCNDEELTEWFEKSMKNPPDRLVFMAHMWKEVTDKETIRAILEALQTVRIGGVSNAHVGASGRRTYDFMDDDGDDYVSFRFFKDTFDWGRGIDSYDVLDWGTLKDLDATLGLELWEEDDDE